MNTTPPRPLHPDDGALYTCTNRRARRARAAQHRSAQRVAHRRQVRAVARSRWPFEKKPVPPYALVVSGWTVGDLSLSEIGSKLREIASKIEHFPVFLPPAPGFPGSTA